MPPLSYQRQCLILMVKLILIIIFFSSCNVFAADKDPNTGLLIAPGWELVRMHCGACHSYKLVTAQRADKEGCKKRKIYGNLMQPLRMAY